MTFDNRAATRSSLGLDPKLSEVGQTYSYERKSNKSKDGTSKSIDDQRAVNQETAEEFGLNLLPENQISEEPGLGGNLFWYGFQGTGLDGDDRTGVPFRPALTRIVELMKGGKCKNLIIFSQCRLWRSVMLCHMMLDLMAECAVNLFDRNGQISINSPEGRQSVLQGAVAAQIYRETCAVVSSRGTRSTRKKLKVVVNGNVVGYRHVSKGKIEVLPEEIKLVRRIFKMYVGGMSLTAICRTLMAEGIVLAPDLYETHSVKRNEHTYKIVYPKQIRSILTDVRYRGQQPHEGQVWECNDFLIDGEPAVEQNLFEAAQEIMNGKRRVGNAARTDNYFAGIMKCALCGQYLCLNPSKQKDGTIKRFWQPKKHDVQSWCTHFLPNVTETAVQDYVSATLMPWLMAQLDEMQATIGGSGVLDEIAHIRAQIEAQNEAFKDEIKGIRKTAQAEGKNPSSSILTLQAMYDEEIKELEERVGVLEAEETRHQALVALNERTGTSLEHWESLDDAKKKLVIQSVLRWVAILPSDDFASRPERKGGARSIDRKKDGAPPAGKILFLSAWDTIHTAVIKRVPNPDSATWHKPLGLVPAEIDECLGSCAELPHPAEFAAGLKRSFDGRGYRFHPSEVMPGYFMEAETPIHEVD